MSRFVERSAVPPAPTDKSRPTPKRAPQPPRSPLSQILQLRAAQSAKTSAPAGGLPAKLKAGIEQLSGFAMDDVRVHSNSAAPAKLGALAFAKGSDIHLGPGQDRHLPHEAWHVVQQKQGRVGATMQLRGEAINDDRGLEAEADAMGMRALGAALSGDAPPPPSRRATPGSGAAPIQRTTIVIGYQETDSMFNAALNEIAAPYPVHFFSNDGELLPKGPPSTIGLNLKQGEDRTKIHVVAHGSPGKLASIKLLPEFLETIREMGLFTREVTDVRLGACYAMMREDIRSKSVAFAVAQWLQKHADAEIGQQVKLVAGYTSNTAGEFAKGNPSFDPLDTRSAIEAQHFGLYLFYQTKARLGALYKKRMFTDLWSDCEEEAHDVAEAIVKIAPVKPWPDRSRTTGEEFDVSSERIRNEHWLRPGYTIASVTTENFGDFPRRLIIYESLSAVGGKVTDILAAAVERLYEKYKDEKEPQSPTFGFSPDLGSGPAPQPSVTFGFTPSFGTQSDPSTNLNFMPAFGGMPTFGTQSEDVSSIGFTPTFGTTSDTTDKKVEKK